ncbi:FAD-binding oxidoreductase [Candidatus Poribacteria bacterium]|nr:FAD-binding oxidoreductase [Candidatus Poribacteria bacterium]
MLDRIDALHSRFANILGNEHASIAQSGIPDIGVLHPVVVITPSSVEQVSDVLRAATDERASVVPCGNGSALSIGNLDGSAEVLLSLRELNRTIDYESNDLTAVAEAGKPIAALQQEIAPSRQFLALDPARQDMATVGGVIATNDSGPLRRMYGTPRDLTLGVKAVLADGTVVKGGGRVVKTVAGYDTVRLLVGSLGTLAVVVEAAFRLHPVPERRAATLATFADWASARAGADGIVHSELHPTFLEMLNLGDDVWGEYGTRSHAPSVLACFAGTQEEADYQVERASELLRGSNAADVAQYADEGADFWQELLQATLSAWRSESESVVCRVSVPIVQVQQAIETGSRLAAARDLGVQYLAHYANGSVMCRFRLPTPEAASPASDAVDSLRTELLPVGGRVVVENAPVGVKRQLDVWGPPTGPVAWMRRLKDRMDPHHLLNRGRFLPALDSPA